MKKGFTLVELLAVIIILSIIGLISVPIITSNINKTRVNGYRNSVQNAMEAAKEYVSKTMENNDFPESGINIKNIEFKSGSFESGIIKRNEEGEIIASNVYNGEYCANGTKQNIIVEKVGSVEECNSIDYTAPELKIKVVRVTNTSIMVNAYGYEESSKIIGYSFKIGSNEKKEEKTEKRVASYEFKGLQAGIEYEIEVEVKNENANKNDKQYTEETHTTRKSIKVRTTEVGVPLFKVSSNSYAKSKEITITYPKIKDGVNSYRVREYKEGAEETEVGVEGQETSLELTKNGRITAKIDYGSGYVENSINIIGIDDKGPEIVEIDNPDTWEKKKVLTITVKDTGSGLSGRPYSFDEGKTWIKGNNENKPNVISRVYTKPQEVTFLVRDKMGNISSVEEYLGGTGKKIIISKLDQTIPTCKLKVVSGTIGSNGWYKDGSIKDVTVGFEELKDTAVDEKGTVLITNGIKKTEITNTSIEGKSIKENKGKQTTTIEEVKNNVTIIKKDGEYKAKATIYDEAGNSGTCEIEVKRDITKPNIKVEMVGTKINNNSLYQGDKEILKDQVAYQTGSYIKTTCEDETSGVGYTEGNQAFSETSTESLKRYKKTGKCIDKAGNESTLDSETYLILHSVPNITKCGTYQAACNPYNCNPYQCNPHNCNPYNCSPYSCNAYSCGCTTCCTPIYGQVPYSYACGSYCTGTKYIDSYTRVCYAWATRYCTGYQTVQTGQSCSTCGCSTCWNTCYHTCYDTCYDTCYHTCWHTCTYTASCWQL